MQGIPNLFLSLLMALLSVCCKPPLHSPPASRPHLLPEGKESIPCVGYRPIMENVLADEHLAEQCCYIALKCQKDSACACILELHLQAMRYGHIRNLEFLMFSRCRATQNKTYDLFMGCFLEVAEDQEW